MRGLAKVAGLVISVLALLACAPPGRDNRAVGLWQGELEYPGLRVRIAFRIDAAPQGGLAATLIRPDHGDQAIPADETVMEEGCIRLVMRPVQAVYTGQVAPDGATIRGEWNQRDQSRPLTLHRVTEITTSRRPQTPTPPYPYRVEEVYYESLDPGVRLAGTLTIPSGRRGCPAVLLLSGVGAHSRDYVVLGHRRFLVLADHLTRNGIAVLRFDDRGVGGSTGDRSHATSQTFSLDALAGLELLVGRSEVDPDKVGLVGHSEGGIVAALAAARSSDVSFIVMLGTPGLPGREYNLQYEASVWRAMGLGERDIAAKRELQERILAVIIDQADPEVARAELVGMLENLDPPMPRPRLEAAVRRFLSPWFRFSVTHDPGATLRELRCPVLALTGGKDVQVPPEANLRAIEGALQSGGNPDYEVRELPGLNHFLQTAQTGSPEEYGTIEETMAPGAMRAITDWILARTSTRVAPPASVRHPSVRP